MVASTIARQDFNEIKVAGEYAYQIGQILKDKLGGMKVKAFNYYPTGSAVSDTTVYSVTVNVRNVTDNTVTPYVIEYTANATDGVSEVLQGLSQWITDNASEHLGTRVYVNYTADTEKHMFILPRDGYVMAETAKDNMSSDTAQVWTESTVPASYLAYGKQPESGLPRIIVTPVNINTICDKMEESVIKVDNVDTTFTSSALDFTFNITCEAGDTDKVLETGQSASSILNTLRKRLVDERARTTLQNSLNAVCQPIANISSLPLSSYTQWMDIASCTVDMQCTDMYIPEDQVGFIEAVETLGSSLIAPEGVTYKYQGSDEVALYTENVLTDTRTP